MQYFEKEDRFAYQVNYKEIMILPVLHKNWMQFFGMKPSTAYLAFKRIDDLFIALDKNQNLTTWKITTGKTKMIKKIKRDLGLNEYELYEMQMSNYEEE